MSKKEPWEPDYLRAEEERYTSERDDGHEGRTSEGWESFVPEFVKRSLFGSGQQEKNQREDTGRGWLPREVARELANIPKEVAREMARGMWAQADRLKTETSKAIANELRRFLSQLDLWQELRKTLDGTALEIEMKVRFRAQDDGQSLGHEVEHLHVERMDSEMPQTTDETEESQELVPVESPKKTTSEVVKKPTGTESSPPTKGSAEPAPKAQAAPKVQAAPLVKTPSTEVAEETAKVVKEAKVPLAEEQEVSPPSVQKAPQKEEKEL
ncbi:MAG: hypothetical protein H6727_08865 [Myxococcales bacterium]|nr:hypothetical protein [Myxococcales bacterium]